MPAFLNYIFIACRSTFLFQELLFERKLDRGIQLFWELWDTERKQPSYFRPLGPPIFRKFFENKALKAPDWFRPFRLRKIWPSLLKIYPPLFLFRVYQWILPANPREDIGGYAQKWCRFKFKRPNILSSRRKHLTSVPLEARINSERGAQPFSVDFQIKSQ